MARFASVLFSAVSVVGVATACACDRDESSATASIDARLEEAIDLATRSASVSNPNKERELVTAAVQLFDEVIPLLPAGSDAYWDTRGRLAQFLPVIDCDRAKAEVIAQARQRPDKKAMAKIVVTVAMRIRGRGRPEIANALVLEAGPLAGISTGEIEAITRVSR